MDGALNPAGTNGCRKTTGTFRFIGGYIDRGIVGQANGFGECRIFWLAKDTDVKTTQEKLVDGIADDVRFGIGSQLDKKNNVCCLQALKLGKVEAGGTERDEGEAGIPGFRAGIQRIDEPLVESALLLIVGIGQQGRLLQVENMA